MNSNLTSAYAGRDLDGGACGGAALSSQSDPGSAAAASCGLCRRRTGAVLSAGRDRLRLDVRPTRRAALGLSRVFPSRGGDCGASPHDVRRDWAALAFGADPARRRRLHVCAGFIPKAAGDGGAVPVFHLRGARLAARPRGAGAGAVCWEPTIASGRRSSRPNAVVVSQKLHWRPRRSPSPFCSSLGRKRRMRFGARFGAAAGVANRRDRCDRRDDEQRGARFGGESVCDQ